MNNRFWALCLLLVLALLAVFSGCTGSSAHADPAVPVVETPVAGEKATPALMETAGHSSGSPAVGSITEQLTAVNSKSPVWSEASRMFRNIKTTGYVHPPYSVDDKAGIYKFDCLGFVDHVLMAADMTSYKAIGKNVNPSIESYSAYFTKLDAKTPNALGWTRVAHPADLKPGDICLWLKPSTLDTGHMWIIAGEPGINPKRTEEILVRIFDSTGTSHSNDSRANSAFRTGLGSGILGFMVDGEGNPIGLYWEGGVSTSAGEKDTTIICGRLNR